MSWNYAELSRQAKLAGGPEKLANCIFVQGFNRGNVVGIAEGVIGTIVVFYAIQFITTKRNEYIAKKNEEVEQLKESFVEEMKKAEEEG